MSAIDFTQYLRSLDGYKNMPHIKISKRNTDRFVVYNKSKNRLDRFAGDFYQEEEYWKVIMWANPDFYYEFDIPDNTVIRIPLPKNEVINEITKQIIEKQEK